MLMETYYRIQLNIMAAILLLCVVLIASKKLDKKDLLNRAFLFMSVIVFIELLVEAATCLFNNNPSVVYVMFSNMFSILLFILAPVISITFLLFIELVVYPVTQTTKLIRILLFTPLVIQAILSLTSPFLGFYFYVDIDGVYHRGSLFLLSAFITYGYLITGIFYIIYHRKKIIRSDQFLLLIIGAVPIIGGILQSMFYGLLMMWSSAAFALVLSYIFLQERMIHLDILTSTWARESFYFTFSRRIRKNPSDVFGAIYFDIDGLKEINDQYGHDEGDKAIQKIVSIIKNTIRLKYNIARLGGDEFIIALETANRDVISKILSDIKTNMNTYNLQNNSAYKLKCSYGYDLYDNHKFEDLESFLKHIDSLMYLDKRHLS